MKSRNTCRFNFTFVYDYLLHGSRMLVTKSLPLLILGFLAENDDSPPLNLECLFHPSHASSQIKIVISQISFKVINYLLGLDWLLTYFWVWLQNKIKPTATSAAELKFISQRNTNENKSDEYDFTYALAQMFGMFGRISAFALMTPIIGIVGLIYFSILFVTNYMALKTSFNQDKNNHSNDDNEVVKMYNHFIDWFLWFLVIPAPTLLFLFWEKEAKTDLEFYRPVVLLCITVSIFVIEWIWTSFKKSSCCK